jgi:hypothetical protein
MAPTRRLHHVPRFLSRTTVAVGIYAAIMAGAALWMPHEWDWTVFQWFSSRVEPEFAKEVTLVDVPWDPSDVPGNRRRIATFLDELVVNKQQPDAVILDVEFDPCPSKPCGEPMESAREALVSGVRKAAQSFPVYATEELPVDRDDDVNGPLDRHDSAIYGVLTGAAQTRFTSVPSAQGLFYRNCYPDVQFVDDSGRVQGIESVWSMVDRVLPEFANAPCDTSHIAVRLGPKIALTAPRVYVLGVNGRFRERPNLDRQYVIVGTLEYDRSPYVDRSGPEILGWALSNQLLGASLNGAKTSYAAQPQNEMLLFVVPSFSGITVLAFAALFFPTKRLHLRATRIFLPWLTAGLAATIALAIFAAFETLMYRYHQIYPQVSLISLGIIVTATLSGVRGSQILIDETQRIDPVATESYDYDVFISYAHDEGAWVSEHVVAPFRNATLPDGKKLSVFFDTSSIRSGTAWQTKLALAIDGSRFIVPVYSELYFQKPYCRFEIMRAHRKWVVAGEDSRCVLPIMRGKPKILAAVDDIQALSLDDHTDLIERLLAEIVERLSST